MATQKVYANKDAWIDLDDPDTNHGSGSTIEVFKNANAGYRDVLRTLLEFDVSNVLDVPIVNITCHLYLRQYSENEALEISFRRLDAQFTENTVTWNNQPANTDYQKTTTWEGTGWKNVDITTILKGVLRDENAYLGILARYTDEVLDGITYHRNAFNSREEGGTTYDPYILITYDTYSQTLLHGSLCKNLLFQDGFGEITMTDHNCPTGDAATFTFKTEWDATHSIVLLNVDETVEYTSGTKHHSFKLHSMSCDSAPCDNLAAATIEEKFWDTGHAYVKTDGDDDHNGRSWDGAWKTITHAANEVFDGQDVRIGFGTYDSETDIIPDNVGSTGIKYTPETADSGGGTGSVTVNV